MSQLPPKVFISYKWEDDAHNRWIEQFATDLRAAGIDAVLDRWEVRLGDSFTEYMTSKIKEADVVLFVMTTRSVAAVESPKGQGGALKFEMQMATSRRIAGEMRLIGIYREGNDTATHLRDHRYADFRDDSEYDAALKELSDDLFGIEKRPPLNIRVDANYEYTPSPVGASSQIEDKDFRVLRAIYTYSLEENTAFIDISRFAQSKQFAAVSPSVGDDLFDIIEILVDSGYFDNPHKVGGRLLIVQGNSYGFYACAAFLGFQNLDDLIQSAIHTVVQHGIPITGDELAKALTPYGILSSTVILYLLKIMRNRGWIRFVQTMGGSPPEITGLTPQGKRAGG